jgi:hypothetical protein
MNRIIAIIGANNYRAGEKDSCIQCKKISLIASIHLRK